MEASLQLLPGLPLLGKFSLQLFDTAREVLPARWYRVRHAKSDSNSAPMRKCCLRMTGDSITEARQALREAVSLLPALGKEAAGPLSDALDRVARSLDRIEGLESRLAIQMELLDERLLRVENNRVFAAWRAILSKAARFRRPPHESGTGDYAAWVAHQQSALPSIDAARATSSQWRRKPLMAVLPLVADITVEPQWYPHTTTVADADYMCLISAPGRVSPLALHFAAEALQAGDCDIIYGDEDHIDSNGGRTDPIFRPGWSPDLLTSSPYMGSLVIVSRHVLDDIGGIRPGFEASDLHDLTLRATDSRFGHTCWLLTRSFPKKPRACLSRCAMKASCTRLTPPRRRKRKMRFCKKWCCR